MSAENLLLEAGAGHTKNGSTACKNLRQRVAGEGSLGIIVVTISVVVARDGTSGWQGENDDRKQQRCKKGGHSSDHRLFTSERASTGQEMSASLFSGPIMGGTNFGIELRDKLSIEMGSEP